MFQVVILISGGLAEITQVMSEVECSPDVRSEVEAGLNLRLDVVAHVIVK